MLKANWKPAERELYANQFVWVFEEQDRKEQYLCEMRSGPLAGEFRWFKESEFVGIRTPPSDKTGYNGSREPS
jgi:hypothetical protein